VKSIDNLRPVIRSSESSGLPSSLQEKEKFKQESKVPIAPKKVQVGEIVILRNRKNEYISFYCILQDF